MNLLLVHVVTVSAECHSYLLCICVCVCACACVYFSAEYQEEQQFQLEQQGAMVEMAEEAEFPDESGDEDCISEGGMARVKVECSSPDPSGGLSPSSVARLESAGLASAMPYAVSIPSHLE